MAAAVYVLCALTASLCAVLLFQAWRRSRLPLLFWSGLCFAGLTAGNVLLVVDLLVLPDVSLFVWRNAVALVSVALLLYGLIWRMD
ncbi:MAG TPA: DUF5985 family protein [Candidatus Tectomicrobia bacterium]|nr:DUF5985 family protein [Candidatus Tectomicrobia bacterium]